MAASFAKHVTERDPVFLDEHLETFKRAKVGIQQELGERAKLCGPVPAIAAVNQDVLLFDGERI